MPSICLSGKLFPSVGALFLCLFVSSCGVSQGYYKKIDTHLSNGDFDRAEVIVAKDEYGKRNRLLYALDKGMLSHYSGEYAKSNEFFTKADDIGEELFTKSVSQRVSSYITNDNVRDYPGEDFELALVNLFQAINYLMLGNTENALVMARRVDYKLKAIYDRYEYENAKQREEGERVSIAYTEDAFIRYLTGMVYEATGDLNNAFISYRNALKIFRDYGQFYGTPLPPSLPEDLLRTSEALGLTEEFEGYKKEFPERPWIKAADLAKMGEAVLIFYNGPAPLKKEFIIDLNISSMNAPLVEVSVPGYQPSNLDPMGIRISLPEYESRPRSTRWAELVAEGSETKSVRSELMEDIEHIAMRNLKDRYPSIRRRALVRVIIKAVSSRAIDASARKNLGLLGEILGAVTMAVAKYSEVADLRCWRTLPAEIQLARLPVATGEQRFKASLSNGHVVDLGKHVIKPGEKKFFIIPSLH